MNQNSAQPPVVARFTDGTSFVGQSITRSALADLQMKSRLLSALWISTDDRVQVDTLLPLLSTRLPNLNDLRITLVHPNSRDRASLSVPVIDLQAGLFPVLEVLRLDGVGAKMSTGVPVPSSLRELSLNNYPATDKIIQLPRLMNAVASWPYLETLHFRRYGGSLMVPDGWTPPHVRPIGPLKDIVLEDDPVVLDNLNHIWGLLTSVNVTVISTKGILFDEPVAGLQEHGMVLKAMLGLGIWNTTPTYRPLILTMVKSLEVSVCRPVHRFMGETVDGNKLVFELPAWPKWTPGEALQSILLKGCPVLDRSPVRSATFRGDLSRVTTFLWGNALNALAARAGGLAKARVEDISGQESTSLLEALVKPWHNAPPAPIVGSQLQSLEIHSKHYGLAFLEDLIICLAQRDSMGLPKFTSLSVEINAEVMRKFASEVQVRKSKLDRLVGACVVRPAH
ncbi:hypothetical protein C8Q77DRAFT_439617 [Trametes polyzona]|nr:hypothetical protein C8Q77DRAFT_439617 [Trametes polyzona]